MTMHILCSTDKNYIMPTGVMIKSVSVNNKDADIVFHVIVDETVCEKYQKQLCGVVKDNDRHTVEFLLFDETMLNTFPQIGKENLHVTKATYYRLFVSNLLSNNINKVLYLDCDIIVNNSLDALWNCDISDFAVGGVTDVSESVHDYQRLGYNCELGYFNAGVLLINLKYWREHHVVDNFMDLIIYHQNRIKLHDQDVLNMCFCKTKKTLDIKYNLQKWFLVKTEYASYDVAKYDKSIVEAISNPVIIHYTDKIKPWYVECDNPLKHIWLKYVRLTRWKYNYKKRKFPISFKTKIGNMLRRMHLLHQLPLEKNNYREMLLTIGK